ncbi:Serine/threonine-protein phosphatase 2A activator 1 [Savitreella phatthalungensis]
MKRIRTEADVATFLRTSAYSRLTHRLQTLCREARGAADHGNTGLDGLLEELNKALDNYPPGNTKHRFGDPSVRDWHAFLKEHGMPLLFRHLNITDEDVLTYLLGAFGSPERLDYGTGHELSFLALVEALMQLGALATDANALTHICKRTVRTYFSLVQRLIKTYKLEPAGSHGVWGLDDHFAIPYIIGAAELLDSELQPSITADKAAMESRRADSLYFEAVAFVNEVKKGPFWEHSPMLYDISAVPSWQKVASGMHKLYAAEVLGKFPVIQHFAFTRFLPWDAPLRPIEPDITQQPLANTIGMATGVGVGGAAGTVAPFEASGARTVHPKVLADMRRRGESG